YDNRKTLWNFVEARLLRIFPALFFAVLITVFIFGAWATTLPLGQYFAKEEVWKYLFSNITLFDYEASLPGVFETNPDGSAVNGSLWTLPTELKMYMAVAIAGILGLFKRRIMFNLLFLAGFILWHLLPSEITEIKRFQHLLLVAFFLIGWFFYLNRSFISLDTSLMLLVVALSIALGLSGFAYTWTFASLALAYFILWFAYSPQLRTLHGFNRFGDYSYGIYIYAFPIQQSIIFLFPDISPLALMSSAFVVTFFFAFLSWHLSEIHALRQKGKLNLLRTIPGSNLTIAHITGGVCAAIFVFYMFAVNEEIEVVLAQTSVRGPWVIAVSAIVLWLALRGTPALASFRNLAQCQRLRRHGVNLKDLWLGTQLLAWERAPIGIEQVDLRGPLLQVNRRLCEMLGYSREELEKLSFRDITHPDDLPSEEKLLSQLIAGEIRSYSIEKRYLHNNRAAVPVRVTSSQVHRSGPSGGYRISIIEDIAHTDAALPQVETLDSRAGKRFSLFGRLNGLNEAISRAIAECKAYRDHARAHGGSLKLRTMV
ncbi:MAG: PAS domain S-box protein, partial [Burkholderiales bacterium]